MISHFSLFESSFENPPMLLLLSLFGCRHVGFVCIVGICVDVVCDVVVCLSVCRCY